jgi:RND family efflux transporter, MFP subunit
MKIKFKINKKIIILGIVVLGVLGVVTYSHAKAQKAKIKGVSTAKVTKKNLIQTASDKGNIEANYRNDITLNPAQKVKKVMVSEGQQVKKGDILVKLDTLEYDNQLEKQKINLVNAQSTLRQLLNSGVANDKSNAQNTVSQAQITLENAQRSYEDANNKFKQSESLLKGGYISQNDYDATKKALDDADNAVKAAENSLGNSQSALNNVNGSSEDKITNQKNQVALIQVDIDNLNKKIEECNVKADTDGKVIKIDAKEGQFPKTGDMIIVDDTSKYKVSVNISQYDSAKIKAGQKANIKLKSSTKKYTGVVTDIGQFAELKSSSTSSNSSSQESKVNVKITIDNPDDGIKAGFEVDVEIVLDEKKSVFAIGFDAIKEEKAAGKKYVYIVNKDNKVSKKYIKTGLDTEYDVEVTDGLKEGDKCVLNPPQNLKEGDIVTEASTSTAGGSKK